MGQTVKKSEENICIGHFHCTTTRTLNVWICLSDFCDVTHGIRAFTVEVFRQCNGKKRNILAWSEYGNPSLKKKSQVALFRCTETPLINHHFLCGYFWLISGKWTGVNYNINGFVFFPPSVSDDNVPAHALTVTWSWHIHLQCSYYLVTPFCQNLATSGVNLF